MSTYQGNEEGRGSFSTSTNTKYLSCRYVSEEDDRRKSRERQRWEKMLGNCYGLWEMTVWFSESLGELQGWGSWRWDLFWAGRCIMILFNKWDKGNERCSPYKSLIIVLISQGEKNEMVAEDVWKDMIHVVWMSMESEDLGLGLLFVFLVYGERLSQCIFLV